MQKVLSVSPDTLSKLAKFAKDALPLESCALLLGSEQHNTNFVHDVVMLRNYDRSKYSFSIQPDDLFFAYQYANELGLSIVGIFHSHPSLPFPSNKDNKFMKLNPIVWLRYSTLNQKYSAFIYSGHIVEEVKIVLIKD